MRRVRLQHEASTRVQARAWILANVPRGSHVAQEWYTAPIDRRDVLGYGIERFGTAPDTGLVVWQRKWLAQGLTVSEMSRWADYAVVSSGVCGRYFAESARYPAEGGFYRTLFAEGELLQECRPSPTRGGPSILVYRLHRRRSGTQP